MNEYLTQAETMTFAEKLGFVLGLLAQGKIDERDGYQIITAEGSPHRVQHGKAQCGTIDFL